MNPYILSVGLNVGSKEPAAQLGATLRAAEMLFGPPVSVAMGRSEWQGVPERFIQIAVLSTPYAVATAAPRLALALQQDTVAVIHATTAPHATWILYNRCGIDSIGGTVAEFPIIATHPQE